MTAPAEPAPDEPALGEPALAEPEGPPSEPPPKSFIPRMLPGSDPAEGDEVGGNVPTGGMTGDGLAAGPESPADDSAPREPPAAEPGEGPGPRLEPEIGADGEPVCPMRGAAAPEGAAAGRAAAGVPPPSSEEEDAAPVEAPAAGRVAADAPVPLDPVPAPGAAATRGVAKLLGAEGFVADEGAAGAVPRLLAPKLGGAEGEAAPAPDPAGGIVGTVDSAAG